MYKFFTSLRFYKLFYNSIIYVFFFGSFLTVNAQKPLNKLSKSHEVSSEMKSLLEFYNKQIYFTQNEGQFPEEIKFKAEFPLGQAFATDKGMVMGSFDPKDMKESFEQGMREEEAHHNHKSFKEDRVKIKGHRWMLNFLNSSPNIVLESKSMHGDVFNYYNASSKRNGIQGASNYQELWYNNVYDNVDLRYYPSKEGSLEYDLICKPGFNKDNIAIKFDGISNLRIKSNGSLVLATSIGDMELPSPIAYQKIKGKKVSVPAVYRLEGGTLKFEIGEFQSATF